MDSRSSPAVKPSTCQPLSTSFLGGAVAGVSVDIALYPLDTLKTRLQSQYGFWNSGGFKGIYKGVGPTSIGSPLSGGLFFGTYEAVKKVLPAEIPEHYYPVVHMCSASFAEIVCCVVKVPMEIVKQRRQASYKNMSSIQILISAVKREGVYGLYRGYGSTVLRDIPFSVIEFPIWEWLKKTWKTKTQRELSAVEVAVCGAVAGGVAAALTTPLDVVKTQIMLSENVSARHTTSPSISSFMRSIYRQHGFTRLFAGFVPRITMIMLGGGIFFGVYDESCKLVNQHVS
ncbi:mitochondrial S-adenosylmethionine carrier protein [Planococcus citri]|uniref:mitochondrial S-adenosylmethionine carrier protein n=1 Tax=Planococcus citri TaxID=170843 RepID=UPI0031F92D5D